MWAIRPSDPDDDEFMLNAAPHKSKSAKWNIVSVMALALMFVTSASAITTPEVGDVETTRYVSSTANNPRPSMSAHNATAMSPELP